MPLAGGVRRSDKQGVGAIRPAPLFFNMACRSRMGLVWTEKITRVVN